MVGRIARSFAVVVGVLALSGWWVPPSWAGHSWGTYHWARTANPFALNLIDSVSANWQAQLEIAQEDWNKLRQANSSPSTVLDLAVVSGDESVKTRKRCAASQGQVRVCNAAYGQNGWLGLAQIWLNAQGDITAGTAKMNDSYSSYWTSYPTEKQHVMCQEVGHVFGLGHQSESGAILKTCMDYSTSPLSQHPNDHDYEQLEIIYKYLDSTSTTVASTTVATSPGRCEGRECSNQDFDGETWGYLVSKSEHHETYMRRLPDGGALLTHLYMLNER